MPLTGSPGDVTQSFSGGARCRVSDGVDRHDDISERGGIET